MPSPGGELCASMFGDSPHAETERELRTRAYRLLARREHSRAELHRKLTQTRFDAPPPNEVLTALLTELLDELRESGAQSDARFAESLCRLRYQYGRGPLKLRHELTAHQIDETLIAAVMTPYADKWQALASVVRRKKFGDDAPTSYAEWARQARFLQQRGFAFEQIEPYVG